MRRAALWLLTLCAIASLGSQWPEWHSKPTSALPSTLPQQLASSGDGFAQGGAAFVCPSNGDCALFSPDYGETTQCTGTLPDGNGFTSISGANSTCAGGVFDTSALGTTVFTTKDPPGCASDEVCEMWIDMLHVGPDEGNGRDGLGFNGTGRDMCNWHLSSGLLSVQNFSQPLGAGPNDLIVSTGYTIPNDTRVRLTLIWDPTDGGCLGLVDPENARDRIGSLGSARAVNVDNAAIAPVTVRVENFAGRHFVSFENYATCSEGCETQAGATNIVFITLDDVGTQNVLDVATPELDGLSTAGFYTERFTTASICGPTRVSWNTGLFPQTHTVNNPTAPGDVQPEWRWLGAMLADAGVDRREVVGKWGAASSSSSTTQGAANVILSGHTYYAGAPNANPDFLDSPGDWARWEGVEAQTTGTPAAVADQFDGVYNWDWVRDRCIQRLHSMQSKDHFYLECGLNAVHEPANDPAGGAPYTRAAAACGVADEGEDCIDDEMMSWADEAVGLIVDAIPNKTNTVVIVVTDNGTWSQRASERDTAAGANPGGAKFTDNEAGITGPLWAAYGGVAAVAGTADDHIHAADLYATFGDINGFDVRANYTQSAAGDLLHIDGISAWDRLNGTCGTVDCFDPILGTYTSRGAGNGQGGRPGPGLDRHTLRSRQAGLCKLVCDDKLAAGDGEPFCESRSTGSCVRTGYPWACCTGLASGSCDGSNSLVFLLPDETTEETSSPQCASALNVRKWEAQLSNRYHFRMTWCEEGVVSRCQAYEDGSPLQGGMTDALLLHHLGYIETTNGAQVKAPIVETNAPPISGYAMEPHHEGNGECVDVGDPHPGCTGAGTGNVGNVPWISYVTGMPVESDVARFDVVFQLPNLATGSWTPFRLYDAAFANQCSIVWPSDTADVLSLRADGAPNTPLLLNVSTTLDPDEWYVLRLEADGTGNTCTGWLDLFDPTAAYTHWGAGNGQLGYAQTTGTLTSTAEVWSELVVNDATRYLRVAGWRYAAEQDGIISNTAAPVGGIIYVGPENLAGAAKEPANAWGDAGNPGTDPAAPTVFSAAGASNPRLVIAQCGTYVGDESMISIRENRGWSDGPGLYAPNVVRAEEDGCVHLKGDSAPAVTCPGEVVEDICLDDEGPLIITANYWMALGFNSSSLHRTAIRTSGEDKDTDRGQGIRARRIIAWKDPLLCDGPCTIEKDKSRYDAMYGGSDIDDPNVHCSAMSDCDDCEWQDVVAFGWCRKANEMYRDVRPIMRRSAFRNDGNWPYVSPSNHKAITCAYRSIDPRCENIIATIGGSPNPLVHPADYDDRPSVFSTDGQAVRSDGTFDSWIPEGRDAHNIGMTIEASIGYALDTAFLTANDGNRIGAAGSFPNKGVKGVTLRDFATRIQAEADRGIGLYECDDALQEPCTQVEGGLCEGGCNWTRGDDQVAAPTTYERVYARGSGNFTSDQWVDAGGNDLGTDTAERGNIWDGTSANICLRMRNGVLSDKPLFPWPMQERLNAVASLTEWEAWDIEADLQTAFELIPTECGGPGDASDATLPATLPFTL